MVTPSPTRPVRLPSIHRSALRVEYRRILRRAERRARRRRVTGWTLIISAGVLAFLAAYRVIEQLAATSGAFL